MKNTLVIFAHPYFEYSKLNRELLKVYAGFEHVTIRDLYEEYPDLHVPAFRERKRIVDYERLVFHFPLIWFSFPPLLKLWIDEVFDMTWMMEDYHPLTNKDAMIVVTAGGKQQQYTPEGTYGTTLENLLKPIKISLKVNNIEVTEILTVYNADHLSKEETADVKNQLIHLLNTP